MHTKSIAYMELLARLKFGNLLKVLLTVLVC